MKIKQRPDDFRVTESWRFDKADDGRYRVYLMDKRKLSTFEAVERVRERFGLRPGAVSYCGLKDKQGRTEQIIAVDSDKEIDLQEPDLRLRLLGRTKKALTAQNLTSNRFSVTVRALQPDDLRQLTLSAAEVGRLGVVNYFDSQRFGSLKHGQGYIAKDLIRGDFEAALHNYMAQPSPLDRTDDAKVKAFWKANWGRWDRSPQVKGNAKYYRILKVLREDPRDFVNAFLQIDQNYRALLLFTYQSYLWNEGVRRLLQLLLPREHLFPMPYQAGTLLFHRGAGSDVSRELRELGFPLLAPSSTFTHPKVQEAVEWVLGKEKLKLSDLRIEEAPQMLFFKHEERPVLAWPDKLVLGRPMRDELNRGFSKINVAFTLPPGAYATLVIKRLFHFAWLGDDHQEPSPRTPFGEPQAPASLPGRVAKHGGYKDPRRQAEVSAPAAAPPSPAPVAELPPEAPPVPAAEPARAKLPAKDRPAQQPQQKKRAEPGLGFRAKQKAKKAHREQARVEQAAKRPKPRAKSPSKKRR